MRRAMTMVVGALLIAALLPGVASATSLQWTDDPGAAMHGVAVGPDGSVYVVGERDFSITRKAILVKYSPQGDRLWTRSWIPFVQASTHGVDVAVGPDGLIAYVGRVQGQCEGGGWFIEVIRPGGGLVRRYVTPGWECEIAQTPSDIAVTGSQIVVTGFDNGCCGDVFQDGWVRGFDRTAHPTWQTNFEPPADVPTAYYDRATGLTVGGLGNMYVVGWAASQNVQPDTVRWSGSLVIQKMSSGGGVIWRKRGFTGRYTWETPAEASVRGNTLAVVTSSRAGSLHWGSGAPPEAWLGRFTTGGDRVWTRTWGEDWSFAAEPSDVSIDPSGDIWVSATRRDPVDRGFDLQVKRFGMGGAPEWTLVSGVSPNGSLHGTGVAAWARGRAAVVGFHSTRNLPLGYKGRIWVFGPESP